MERVELLLKKINRNEPLDFGDILSESIQLFKKTWLQGFLFFLFMTIIMIPFFTAIYLPIYQSVMDQFQNGTLDPNNPSNSILLQTNTYRFTIIGATFLTSLVILPLNAGFYRIVNKIDLNEDFRFNDFFYFFNSRYFLKILSIVSFSILISLMNFGFEKVLPQTLASILSIVISFVYSVYYMLIVAFMAFEEKLDSYGIFKLSFSLGTKKWLLIFGLLIVTGLMASLGVIACCIGVLFTFSIIYLPIYLIYKSIIGFNETSEIDLIGTE